MNKFSKGKTIGIIAASLAAVSLVGVGFSAWVINGTNFTNIDNITVNVADVQDKRVEIQNAKVTDSTVKFDSNSTSGTLLKGDSNSEDLSFAISYTVKNYTTNNKFKIFAYFSTEGIGEKYKELVEKGLITLPYGIGYGTTIVETVSKGNGILVFDGTSVPTDGSQSDATIITKISEQAVGETYTVTQTFKFGWGAAFASKNPCNVEKTDKIYDYDRNDSSTQNGNVDTLKKNLSYLKTQIGSNATFALTLSAEITNS